MNRRIVLSIILVATCATFASVGGAASASTQRCSGPSVGTLFVQLGGDDGRLFVDGSTITLEDLATHELVPCRYRGQIPATPQNTNTIIVEEIGGITFDGVGGMFGAKDIKALNTGQITVIGTPASDEITGYCRTHGRHRICPAIRFNDATIVSGPSSGAGPLFGAGGDDDISIDGRWGFPAHGGSGNDNIFVGSGNGRQGGAALYGDAGNDNLTGGMGADQFDGGPGNDYMSGGVGRDTFHAVDGEADHLDGGPDFDEAWIDHGLDTTISIQKIH